MLYYWLLVEDVGRSFEFFGLQRVLWKGLISKIVKRCFKRKNLWKIEDRVNLKLRITVKRRRKEKSSFESNMSRGTRKNLKKGGSRRKLWMLVFEIRAGII